MKELNCYNAKTSELLKRDTNYFVGYITAGYPNIEDFFRIVQNCDNAGMQIFEIGFPSDNPYGDGDLIKHAHSLINHAIIKEIEFWRRLRRSIHKPIWLMGYREELIDAGTYRILAEEMLIDALVIPNIEVYQRIDLLKEMEPFGVDVLGFVSDAKTEIENNITFEKFPLIYQQLYTGPTGVQNNSNEYLSLLTRAKETAKGYLFAGFGIGTTERVKELLDNGFDGVIIGTAFMKKLEQSESELLRFVHEMETMVKGVE